MTFLIVLVVVLSSRFEVKRIKPIPNGGLIQYLYAPLGKRTGHSHPMTIVLIYFRMNKTEMYCITIVYNKFSYSINSDKYYSNCRIGLRNKTV